LAAISNAGQLLQAIETQQGFSTRAVEIINRQVKHLSRLIEDLLDVARVTSGKVTLTRERVNLAALVQRSLDVLRGNGRLDQLHLVVQAEPVWVDADPARLSQIVDNLLMNAIKFTPPGGQIEVQAGSEGDDAVLRIRDSGIGIAPELLPRVFDLFTQGPRSLDRSQGGLGVGLTLAHRLAQAHGGHIVAASEGLSKGSTFVVSLPRADPPRTAQTSRPPLAGTNGSPKRILIIEDDADGREALRMQLLNAGHDVYAAATGIEGIETAARVKPEIVLLDIGLPGLDGYQVAQRLKAGNVVPRLIAITGYGRPQDRERAIEAGIDQHMIKPVDAAELARLLI
jgi:CheY-like chemotaxis protein